MALVAAVIGLYLVVSVARSISAAHGPPPGAWLAGPATGGSMNRHDPASGVTPVAVWGYVPNSRREAAWASAEANLALLSGVSLVDYHPHPNGDLARYRARANVPDWLAV